MVALGLHTTGFQIQHSKGRFVQSQFVHPAPGQGGTACGKRGRTPRKPGKQFHKRYRKARIRWARRTCDKASRKTRASSAPKVLKRTRLLGSCPCCNWV